MLKKLLVAFTTNRTVADKVQRVRFDAGKVVDLTDDEIDLLDRLTKSTGKLHYRSPINESGTNPVADEPEIVQVPDFAGQDKPVSQKSVDELKAYLTFYEVDFASDAKKAALVDLVTAHEAGELDGAGGDDGDPDGGL